MHPEDRVALYELTDQLYLLQDFTGDAGALQRGLVQGKEYAASLHFSRPQTFAADMEAHTMGAMHTIADRLAKVPGRKNFIWLSTGFPPLPLNDGGVGITYEKIVNTAKTLGNADLPLFAIDAKGLAAGGSGGGPVAGGGSRGPSSGVDLPRPPTAVVAATQRRAVRPDSAISSSAKTSPKNRVAARSITRMILPAQFGK
jgi:VWFA-related protein